jgi:hypothetical protein
MNFVARPATGMRGWDSQIALQQNPTRYGAYRDSATGRPMFNCLAIAHLVSVDAGTKTTVAAAFIPSRWILGDSLPAGPYDITIRWFSDKTLLKAGRVELQAP